MERSGGVNGETEAGDAVAERYASIETVDGDVVVYDNEQPTAWLQSSHAVEVRA